MCVRKHLLNSLVDLLEYVTAIKYTNISEHELPYIDLYSASRLLVVRRSPEDEDLHNLTHSSLHAHRVILCRY